ncbi:MAG: 2-C-methyl-D-erythritol 2,4-cyclodiphosphate synthase [Bacillota bacterium]|nr:2-C-methyl-D-erythritol 2,4-cyclodiphosphate synthase [Bacillota bacterium]
MITRCAIGQDSHRFAAPDSGRPLRLAGITIPGCPGLEGNSDADVILHAVTNAVSGITGRNILGRVADELCRSGITDSSAYLKLALEDLYQKPGRRPLHLSVSVEARRPLLAPHIPAMRAALARLLGLTEADIGLTATSGEGLTGPGRGEGIAVLAILTVVEDPCDSFPGM